MFTEIACNIIKVTDDKVPDIEAAEFNLKGKKANLDLVQKEYEQARNAPPRLSRISSSMRT